MEKATLKDWTITIITIIIVGTSMVVGYLAMTKNVFPPTIITGAFSAVMTYYFLIKT